MPPRPCGYFSSKTTPYRPRHDVISPGQWLDVQHAADARTARRFVSANEFDILLSDLGLRAGVVGILCATLPACGPSRRSRERTQHRGRARARSKAAGFAEHLAKPLNPEDLDAAFERLMTDIDGK